MAGESEWTKVAKRTKQEEEEEGGKMVQKP
jgi:hypothetical protein